MKYSLIISLFEIEDALLTTREFFCVEDEKKTGLCLILELHRLVVAGIITVRKNNSWCLQTRLAPA